MTSPTTPWGVPKTPVPKGPSAPEGPKEPEQPRDEVIPKNVQFWVVGACVATIGILSGCALIFMLAMSFPRGQADTKGCGHGANTERSPARAAAQEAYVDGHWWSPQADLETYYEVPPANIIGRQAAERIHGQPGFLPRKLTLTDPRYEDLRKKHRETEQRAEEMEREIERLRNDRNSGKMSNQEFRDGRQVRRWPRKAERTDW